MTIGKQIFSTRDASTDGLTKPVSLSIAKSENKEALPFLIRASIAKVLFRDCVCNGFLLRYILGTEFYKFIGWWSTRRESDKMMN